MPFVYSLYYNNSLVELSTHFSMKELARQSRIFNAKVRTIGVDVDAIDQQVEDKKRRCVCVCVCVCVRVCVCV